MGSCGGDRYNKEVGKKGGCCGGSRGHSRIHRELDVVGCRTGLTCKEAGWRGTVQKYFGHLSLLWVHYDLSNSERSLP